MQNRVYGNSAESTSGNGKLEVPVNVPEDAAFAALYASRRVSYLPQVAAALRHSEAPKRLLDHYVEAATLIASDLLYWTPKSTSNGWVYKSREELYEETGLSRRRQRHARDLLREAEVLEEREVGFRLYYRIRWAGLKPLLRLATESSPDTGSASHDDAESPSRHGDPGYSVSRGETEGPSRLVGQRSVSPGETPSVTTTGWDKQTRQHQSIDARETNDGEEGEAHLGEEAPAADGLIDGYTTEEEAPGDTTERSPSEPTTSGEGGARKKAGGEGEGRERKAPAPACFSMPIPDAGLKPSLWTQISNEMESLTSKDIPEEARKLAGVLAQTLGFKQADPGLVRVAGYAIMRDVPEMLGEIEARRYEDVGHPTRYYAKGLACAIKDEEAAPRKPRRGNPVQRFEAALRRRGGKAFPGPRDGHTAPGEGGEDAPERLPLAGRHAPTVYSVRDASVQRDPGDYFRRGGSEGRAQRERERQEARAKAESQNAKASAQDTETARRASPQSPKNEAPKKIRGAGETGYFVDGKEAHRKRVEAEQKEAEQEEQEAARQR